MKKLFLTFICILAFGSFAFAQSASELNAARAMAKQYGYTEEQINKMMSQQKDKNKKDSKTSKKNSKQSSKVYDENQTFDEEGNVVGNRYGEIPFDMKDSTDLMLIKPAKPAPKDSIYGHIFFKSKGFEIVPSYNAPVPDSFVLGPGDEVVVNIWGATNTSISGVVGKNGSVVLAEAGPVAIGGMTLGAAEKLIRNRLSSIYGGLSSGESKMQLTLGRIRGVSVNVLGEVVTPGVYNLPSLSTIPSAIFMAGGLQELGTVRDITLFRGGKKVGVFDLYDFMMNGNPGANCSLQENDIITVNPAAVIVKAEGAVQRPLLYEMREGETVADLIKYAGGFSSLADRSKAHIDRTVGFTSVSYDVSSSDFANFKLADQDEVTFYENRNPEIRNRVQIYGAVEHEGPYAIGESVSSVSQLIKAAGGLKKGAYLERAILRRTDDEGRYSMIQFNVADVLKGRTDIKLQQQDSLHFYLVKDMIEEQTVLISGAVIEPGVFDYSEGMTLGSLIIMGGGFANGACLTNIEIASRGDRSVGDVVTVNLETNPEAMETPLKAFDQVSIRKNTYNRPLSSVSVEGEVMFPGDYVIESSSVRISDVIERAGRFTPDAYSRGARLVRTMTLEERQRIEQAFEVAKKQAGKDSLTMEDLGLDQNTYTVGIDIVSAMANKGSEDDITLRDGDRIIIPQLNNTVKISGGVLYPNTVGYSKGATLRDYISQAGGYTKKARRGLVYVVYMNGTAAAKGSRQFHMEPGMEIIVPEKGERQSMSPAEIASLASTATSTAALITTIVNSFVK